MNLLNLRIKKTVLKIAVLLGALSALNAVPANAMLSEVPTEGGQLTQEDLNQSFLYELSRFQTEAGRQDHIVSVLKEIFDEIVRCLNTVEHDDNVRGALGNYVINPLGQVLSYFEKARVDGRIGELTYDALLNKHSDQLKSVRGALSSLITKGKVDFPHWFELGVLLDLAQRLDLLETVPNADVAISETSALTNTSTISSDSGDDGSSSLDVSLNDIGVNSQPTTESTAVSNPVIAPTVNGEYDYRTPGFDVPYVPPADIGATDADDDNGFDNLEDFDEFMSGRYENEENERDHSDFYPPKKVESEDILEESDLNTVVEELMQADEVVALLTNYAKTTLKSHSALAKMLYAYVRKILGATKGGSNVSLRTLYGIKNFSKSLENLARKIENGIEKDDFDEVLNAMDAVVRRVKLYRGYLEKTYIDLEEKKSSKNGLRNSEATKYYLLKKLMSFIDNRYFAIFLDAEDKQKLGLKPLKSGTFVDGSFVRSANAIKELIEMEKFDAEKFRNAKKTLSKFAERFKNHLSYLDSSLQKVARKVKGNGNKKTLRVITTTSSVKKTRKRS